MVSVKEQYWRLASPFMLYLHAHFVSYVILKRDSNYFFPLEDSLEQRILLCLGCVILSTAEYFLVFTLHFSLKPLYPKLDRVFLKLIQQSNLAPELHLWSCSSAVLCREGSQRPQLGEPPFSHKYHCDWLEQDCSNPVRSCYSGHRLSFWEVQVVWTLGAHAGNSWAETSGDAKQWSRKPP